MMRKISNGVKILMLSEDHTIARPGSPAYRRMEQYAALVDELRIVVPAEDNTKAIEQGRLFVYPVHATNAVVRSWRMAVAAHTLLGQHTGMIMSVQAPNEIGLIALLLARLHRISLQVQVHADIMSPWFGRGSWKARLRYRLARVILPRATCIRVVSERIKRSLVDILRLQKTPIFVLPIYTDIAAFLNAAPDPDTQTRFACYTYTMIAVGRFVDQEKNFSMLIRMMKEFVTTCPAALLVIVGDGPDKARYEDLISWYGLADNVMIEPWRDDLPAFFRSFDTLVISSLHEGWSRVAIEAMASGLVVVMTDVGLAGEVVRNQENGVVVPVADESTLLAACLDVYRDPAKRARLAQCARKTIQGPMLATQEAYLARWRASFDNCRL
ncbi:MAG: glycosyltransferase [Candidatus Sungbacteria bacterium]|nr:glycosyltransferase [Candidatus Sungbacteria bacterium]